MGVVPEAAPDCKIAADGSQIMMGDLTKPYNGGASTQSMSSLQEKSEDIFKQSLRQASSSQTHGSASMLSGQAASNTSASNQSQATGQATSADQNAQATGANAPVSLLVGEAVNLNTVLLYNCAAMSYQT
jgi:hypothetical protein